MTKKRFKREREKPEGTGMEIMIKNNTEIAKAITTVKTGHARMEETEIEKQ